MSASGDSTRCASELTKLRAENSKFKSLVRLLGTQVDRRVRAIEDIDTSQPKEDLSEHHVNLLHSLLSPQGPSGNSQLPTMSKQENSRTQVSRSPLIGEEASNSMTRRRRYLWSTEGATRAPGYKKGYADALSKKSPKECECENSTSTSEAPVTQQHLKQAERELARLKQQLRSKAKETDRLQNQLQEKIILLKQQLRSKVKETDRLQNQLQEKINLLEQVSEKKDSKQVSEEKSKQASEEKDSLQHVSNETAHSAKGHQEASMASGTKEELKKELVGVPEAAVSKHRDACGRKELTTPGSLLPFCSRGHEFYMMFGKSGLAWGNFKLLFSLHKLLFSNITLAYDTFKCLSQGYEPPGAEKLVQDCAKGKFSDCLT